LINTETTLNNVLNKAEFWKNTIAITLNDRQKIMINKMVDGFHRKLTTVKWAKITKTSTDTALRDIKDLIEKGILMQNGAGRRSANYSLIFTNC
jgi:Fic family protein